jgi:hypothetical protein
LADLEEAVLRGSDEVDPVSGLGPDDLCWCRSGLSHVTCHGDPLPPSEPGAPITEADDDDHVHIAPDATVERAWLETGLLGAPVFLPEEELAAPRLVVPGVVARMVQPTGRSSPGLAALGVQRFAILDSLGLADPGGLAQRLAELSDSDISDLRFFFLDMARATLECLYAEDQALDKKTVIWAGDADPAPMVGATLLWADHYLVTDRVAELMISSPRPAALAGELRDLLVLRPLIETGMVVPVLEDAAVLAAADAVRAGTEADLRTPSLIEWIDAQVVMEGPTARECLLYSMIDDDEQDVYFRAYGRIIAAEESTRHVLQRMLGPYDPGFDYGPWIAQTRREYIEHIVHGVNKQVAVAGAFGADWVTTSPFKQRLLMRRGGKPATAQALIRANVPQLSGASARALARVAAEDETVHALRETTRESLHAMRSLPPASQREAAAELGRKLQSRADVLSKEISHARRWKLAAPGVAGAAGGIAATAAVAIGAAGPIAGTVDLLTGLGALLVAGGGVLPYRADRAAHRREAAFTLLIGNGLASPRRACRPSRQKPVPFITAIMTPTATAQPSGNECPG